MGVVKNKTDPSQTALTWFLYFILDCITMFSTINAAPQDKGAIPFLLGCSIGSLIMFIILLYQGRKTYNWTELFVTILIFICGTAWVIKGPYHAVVWGIISESIVGIYLIAKTIKDPVVKYNLTGYLLFLASSIVSIYNAKSWSLPDAGYALCESVLSIITIIPLLIQLRKERL